MNLFSKLLLMDEKLVVISAHTSLQQSADMAYEFVQESNFLWLTGIDAPDWLLVMDGHRKKSWLIAPDIADHDQLFDGSLSWDEAKKTSGVDEVIGQAVGMSLLEELATRYDEVWTIGDHPHAAHFNFTVNPAQPELRMKLKKSFKAVKDCQGIFAKLRAIKSPDEIEHIRAAIDITSNAFKLVKQRMPDLRHEYEIEAEFDYYFKKKGYGHAYAPIVASAGHACTLHYGENSDVLSQNALVLIDIGAQVNGYAADITRTYAVGVPSEREKAVHAAVEKAHQEIIALLGPGLSVVGYHEKVDAIMRRAIDGLGLLKTPEDYRKYFPHAISHGLGVDVHDSLGSPETFQPGMVLTVEPGIYIPEEGIGVRIEDDILITETGYENLSQTLSTSL